MVSLKDNQNLLLEEKDRKSFMGNVRILVVRAYEQGLIYSVEMKVELVVLIWSSDVNLLERSTDKTLTRKRDKTTSRKSSVLFRYHKENSHFIKYGSFMFHKPSIRKRFAYQRSSYKLTRRRNKIFQIHLFHLSITKHSMEHYFFSFRNLDKVRKKKNNRWVVEEADGSLWVGGGGTMGGGAEIPLLSQKSFPTSNVIVHSGKIEINKSNQVADVPRLKLLLIESQYLDEVVSIDHRYGIMSNPMSVIMVLIQLLRGSLSGVRIP
ncbi:hypothetical protein K501DRAFT_270151 [Backusella circina FSU 941]|nr:hypothetical protein K501DRAFT_270151 [Backusella circina FSU 941]